MFDHDPIWQKELLCDLVGSEPKEFAYTIGISLSALYNYMNGRMPSTKVLFRIAQYTRRPMDDFLRPQAESTVRLRRVG